MGAYKEAVPKKPLRVLVAHAADLTEDIRLFDNNIVFGGYTLIDILRVPHGRECRGLQ